MKAFFSCVCVICIAFGAISMVKSKGELSKMVNFVFAITFLLSLISAFTGFDYNIDLSIDSTSVATQSNLSKEAFAIAIRDMLLNEGVECKEINIDSSINEDGSISIEKIEVETEFEKEKVISIIKENTGLENIEVT